MNDRRDFLRASLWAAIAMLIAAIVPMWPYGFYTLLRLVITGVSIFAIITLGTAKIGLEAHAQALRIDGHDVPKA
jgi:hypothetical protein